jgi:hypothetical protein
MKRISMMSIILISLLMLIACNSNSSDSQIPSNDLVGVEIQAKNWNTSIKLIDDPALLNSHENGQDLTLRIENLLNTPITFPDNFGAKVLRLDDQNWMSVTNNFYNTGQHILPAKKSYPLGLVVTALPYVPNLQSSIYIRVVIYGYVENNTDEALGAYLDVMLNP